MPLQHAAEVLGIDVANMLMVGDSKNDIIAAKAAGCFSVGVTFGYGDMTLLSQDKATKPDLLIRALPEIYENTATAKKTKTKNNRVYFQTAFSVLSPNQAV